MRFYPILVGCLWCCLAGARAAQVTTETFSAGSSGWVGAVDSFNGEWTFTGGEARVIYFDDFPFPGALATLSNTASASSGAFTGNYHAAGITLLGFRFQAASQLPLNSSVIVEFSGSTSVFQRGFQVVQTGVWHSFSASLRDAAEGRWNALPNSNHLSDFSAALSNVTSFRLMIYRDKMEEHSFLIDDLFLGRLPEASALAPSTGGLARLQGGSLRSGETYRIEAATDLTGTWSLVSSVAATNAAQTFELTNAAERLFWRLAVP